MTLALNQDQLAIEDSVQRYVREHYDFHLNKRAAPGSREEALEHWGNFAELGWLALPISEQRGGLGMGLKEVALMTAALGRGLAHEPFIESVVLAGRLLGKLGSGQHDDLLEQLLEGKATAAFGHEEDHGYAIFPGLKTIARAKGNGFVLNGGKSVVYHAPFADYLILSARSSAQPDEPEGISLFVLPADTPGVTLHHYDTLDNRPAADIVLDNVQVGADSLLGNAGQGLAALRECLVFASLAACAESTAIAQALVELTAVYLRERKQFGTPLASFQALQHKLAEMHMDAEEAAALTAVSIERFEQGSVRDAAPLAADCKNRVDQLCTTVAHQAIQLHGGIGFSDELIVSHYARRVQAMCRRFVIADGNMQMAYPEDLAQ